MSLTETKLIKKIEESDLETLDKRYIEVYMAGIRLSPAEPDNLRLGYTYKIKPVKIALFCNGNTLYYREFSKKTGAMLSTEKQNFIINNLYLTKEEAVDRYMSDLRAADRMIFEKRESLSRLLSDLVDLDYLNNI